MTSNSINTTAPRSSTILSSLGPWISRIVMVPPALIMTLVGVRYIVDPVHAAARTGVALTTPEAFTDTRVVGALTLTIVFVIASSILSLRSLRMGHLTVIALMALILAVRFFGFAVDGTTLAMGDQKVKTIGEAVLLSLNTLGFVLQSYLLKRNEVRE